MGIVLSLLLSGVPSWCPLAPGVEYRTFDFQPAGAKAGTLHVVRVSPEVTLALAAAATDGGLPKKASSWADSERFVATINAGMYETDHRSNVGFMKHGPVVNQPRWNQYRSVLVAQPADGGVPKHALLDWEQWDAGAVSTHAVVVQNLRLIRSPGVSVWKPNGRAWSEAAVARDAQGRTLFLFSREGAQMAAWNDAVLALGLGVQAAMHVEGGPEASLSIRLPKGVEAPACEALKKAGGKLDLAGSYETGFNPNDENPEQWPIPNVLGVRR